MSDHHHGHDEDIDCLIAIEQMYAYLDGELSAEDKAKFEQHMQHCRSCYSRRELELELNQRLKQTNSGELPETLQNRLKSLLDKL